MGPRGTATGPVLYLIEQQIGVNALFTEAIENDFCAKNPMRKVKIPHIAERQREAFPLDDVKIILRYAMGYDSRRTAIAIMTLLLTGLRRGELLGLKWADLTENTLTVNRAVYIKDGKPYVEEHQAKTASSLRTVPLASKCIPAAYVPRILLNLMLTASSSTI